MIDINNVIVKHSKFLKFDLDDSTIIIIDLDETFKKSKMFMWIDLIYSKFDDIPNYDFHMISERGIYNRLVNRNLNKSKITEISDFLK